MNCLPRRILLLFAVTAFAAGGARAQISALPTEVAEQVRAIGPVSEPVGTAKIFAPLHAKEPYAGVKVQRDVAYGPDVRNKLDIFTPEQRGAQLRPVLIYVHGGAFVRGDKTLPNLPFHDNVMLAALKHGFIGVNMAHRHAPKHPYPAGIEDLSMAVQWVLNNIEALGGDPSRVFFMGHSSGGAHVGAYIAKRPFHGPGGIGIRGAILVSGTYDFVTYPTGAHIVAYFGEDRTKYEERSSLQGIVASRLPLLVIDAEIDPPEFLQQTKMLTEKLCAEGRCPERLTLAGHGHISTIYAVNTADRQLMDAVAAFAKKH